MEVVKNKWANLAIFIVAIAAASVIALFIKDKMDEHKAEMLPKTKM